MRSLARRLDRIVSPKPMLLKSGWANPFDSDRLSREELDEMKGLMKVAAKRANVEDLDDVQLDRLATHIFRGNV